MTLLMGSWLNSCWNHWCPSAIMVSDGLNSQTPHPCLNPIHMGTSKVTFLSLVLSEIVLYNVLLSYLKACLFCSKRPQNDTPCNFTVADMNWTVSTFWAHNQCVNNRHFLTYPWFSYDHRKDWGNRNGQNSTSGFFIAHTPLKIFCYLAKQSHRSWILCSVWFGITRNKSKKNIIATRKV